MEREELIKLIMKRIYTRRIYAEELADDILRLFNVVERSEQFKCGKCSSNLGEVRATCFECGHESEDLST